MSRVLSTEERVWITSEYARTQSQRQIIRNWHFPSAPPSRCCVQKLLDKFENHGTLKNLKSSGRPRTALTPLNKNIVSEVFTEAPRTSVRRASVELNIPTSSVWRILKSIEQRAFVPTLVQGLLERDTVDRLVLYL